MAFNIRGSVMKKQKESAEEEYAQLSPEKACEILKNVFYECGIEPPPDCERYFNKKDSLSE